MVRCMGLALHWRILMRRQLTFFVGLAIGVTTMWFTELVQQLRDYANEPFDA